MTPLEILRQQQGEILKMVTALRGLMKPEQLSVAPIAKVTHTLLCDLCTRMREHFEEEEKRLYPTLLAHGPQELRNLSWSFLAGDVAVREQFGDYARRWLKDCDFVFDSDFVRDTQDILDTVARRIDRERTIMIPRLEASGVFVRGGASQGSYAT